MRLLPLLILLAGCAAPMASGKEADELARELEGRGR